MVSWESLVAFLERGQLPGWESRIPTDGSDIKPPDVVIVKEIREEKRGVFGDHVVVGETFTDVAVVQPVRLCTDIQFKQYNFPDSPGSRQPSLVVCGVCHENNCAVIVRPSS